MGWAAAGHWLLKQTWTYRAPFLRWKAMGKPPTPGTGALILLGPAFSIARTLSGALVPALGKPSTQEKGPWDLSEEGTEQTGERR